MDKQDFYYLAGLNEKLQLNVEDKRVPEWFFELVIDRIEKEWFLLKKEIGKVKKQEIILPEDSICLICDDGECENSNAIVFCDGCNIAVHQDWYIIPLTYL
jgi:NuA3 HAT complex component NTO1